MPLPHELAINDDDVKYPPGGSYRYLSTVTDFYAKAPRREPALQELRKVSIVEAKGYCYGWHFYQAGDADMVISSDDALFGHPAFRYVGWGPRLWWWAETMGLRKFSKCCSREGRSVPRRCTTADSSTASCPARTWKRRPSSTQWPVRSPFPPTPSRCRRRFLELYSSTRVSISAAC